MSRVIQLISHNQHLFALTDGGEIFQLRKRRVKCRIEEYWHKVPLPSAEPGVPPRFSLPEEYEPAPCQASASGESFAADKQSESRLNREHVIPDLIAMQMPERPRRPTSIGSDGKYVPVINANHYLE